MATSYSWNITAMSTFPQLDGETDVVVLAQWICVGDDNGTTASIDGNSQFTIQQGAPFTPYNQLTEAQVMQWVFDALGENGINNTQACVQGQINSILNPPVTPSNQPLPWSA